MIVKKRYQVAKLICKWLPPICAQMVRNSIIKISEGESLNLDFITRSFTGSHFYGNTSDFHAFKFSVHGYFDWRNIIIANEVLKKYKGDIVEVGANIGTETISFSDIAGKFDMKVFAYEPLPLNYKVLFTNKTQNEINNLIIFSDVVSDMPGMAYFKIPAENSSGSGHIALNSEVDVHEFNVVTLDESLTGKDISFISIDVEGFEHQVLLGASEIIRIKKPILVVEANKNYLERRGNISLLEFYGYLNDLGYVCYQIGKIGVKEIDISRYATMINKNWLCIPKSKLNLVNSINRALIINALNPFMRKFFF